jgi:hypothetical protein
MQGYFKFNLTDQDDIRAHLRCTKALDMALFIWDLQTNTDKFYQKEEAIFEKTYEDGVHDTLLKIGEMLKERGINIEELII